MRSRPEFKPITCQSPCLADVGKGLYKTVEKTGVGKLHECLRECLETKGRGKTVEEMCEALDEDKARF